MNRWYRLKLEWFATVPPAWSYAAFVVLLLGFEMPRFLASRIADGDVLESMQLVGAEIAILAAAGFYGVWRAAAFFPLYLPSYCKWLETTPWTCRDPLPLGSVQLVWSDLLIPAALTLMSMTFPAFPVWRPALVCLAAYLIVSTLSILSTRQWVHGYCTFFGVGLLAATTIASSPWYSLAVLAGIYYVVRRGLAASLAAFPWADPVDLQILPVKGNSPITEAIAWPHDALQPNPRPLHVIHPHGVILGVLAGLLTFSVSLAAEASGERIQDESWFPVAVAIGVFVIRTLAYKISYATPISLWGRIRTGRWIIPGHDRVFVPQIIAVSAAVLGLALSDRISALVWMPVSIAISITCSLAMGPTRGEWMVLGHHQLRGMWHRSGEARRI